MIRRRRSFFSEAISSLRVEEAKSEFQRSYLLIIFFALILLIAIVNFFLLRDSIVKVYGGTPAFLALISFIVSFLVYQIFVLQYLKAKLRLETGTSAAYKIVQTMIEISFPSVILFYMIDRRNTVAFLDSPAALIYFLFIILSILHLDFKVNIFAGVLAATQYILLVYYGFNCLDQDQTLVTSPPQD